MKVKILYRTTLVIGSILLLSACQKKPLTAVVTHLGSNPPPASSDDPDKNEPPSNNDPGDHEDDSVTGEDPEISTPIKVCYLSGLCLPVMSFDPHSSLGDYLYPNPFQDPQFPSSLNPNQYRPPIALLDLTILDLQEFVSDNFKLSEFLQLRKGPYGILAPLLIERLQALREIFSKSVLVTSGYRSPGYNSGIPGSARFSRHMYGDAVDITSNNLSLKELVNICKDLNASYTQVYQTHVHCDWRNEELSKSFYPEAQKVAGVFQDYIQYITEQSEILIEKIQKHSWQLSAIIPEQEDEGELQVEWTIVPPKGSAVSLVGSTVQLPFRGPGHYTIQALIGGSIKIGKSLDL